jgi:hypothetical protein
MFAPDVCTRCMRPVCTCEAHGVCMWCLHVVFACGVCMWWLHAVFVSGVCMRCLHAVFACSVCMRCLHAVFACGVCTDGRLHITRCLHVVVAPGVRRRITWSGITACIPRNVPFAQHVLHNTKSNLVEKIVWALGT